MTSNLFLLMGLGFQEVLIVALIILLLFGGAKIPELMRGLGRGVKEFKNGMNEIDNSLKEKEKDAADKASE